MRSINPRSFILVPMEARGHVHGVISFLRVGNRELFDDDDYQLAIQLGRRAAISADNARLYTEARRANEAKDEFLGLMSHELRTPITEIHGGARVLRSRGEVLDAETSSGILADIEREANRLSRMLENLLALSRAELDREISVEPVLLQRLLPRFVESLDVGRDRELAFRCEGEPVAVSGEPSYVEHIVRNLVTNAVKYSPSDAPIEVVLHAEPDGASVRVLDRGFGVAEGEATRIFERFYRSDRTAKLASGAGLGLAVCKRLVEAMEGEVWALPREGGGLEVGFRLPAYQVEGDEE
jgi:signal transduction histidine kinase